MANLKLLRKFPDRFYEVTVDIVPVGMDDWCEAAFPQDPAVQVDFTWYGGPVTDRTMQFRHERDMLAFMLRWA